MVGYVQLAGPPTGVPAPLRNAGRPREAGGGSPVPSLLGPLRDQRLISARQAARRTCPHAHFAACRSCWIVCAWISAGMSVTWCEACTPRSVACARSRPHPHAPCGKCGIVSSGLSFHARYDPAAPGCLPGRRFPPAFLRCSSGMRPGRSSVDGGIEEFPLSLNNPSRVGGSLLSQVTLDAQTLAWRRG
jgi:hypothetical protein